MSLYRTEGIDDVTVIQRRKKIANCIFSSYQFISVFSRLFLFIDHKRNLYRLMHDRLIDCEINTYINLQSISQ